jgi:hypothetical protein
MFFIPTHYGKKIDNLNEKESNLLVIDTTMTTLFMKKNEFGLDPIEEFMMMSLGDKRTNTVLDILGWENGKNNEEKLEVLEKIETTNYGYSKFLSDMELNIRKNEEIEKLKQMN